MMQVVDPRMEKMEEQATKKKYLRKQIKWTQQTYSMNVNGNMMLNAPVLVQSQKLSPDSTWMGDHLRIPGAVGFFRRRA